MRNDTAWKAFLSDRERFADLANAFIPGTGGTVCAADIREMDTQAGHIREPGSRKQGSPKLRDTLRLVRFGKKHAVIGIECQESADYSMPLRDMYYAVAAYEFQAAEIRRKARKNRKLRGAERLYRFPKSARLHPAVTLTLYCGADDWDAPKSLHGMADFTGLPDGIQSMAPDYRMNLVHVRKLTDTSMFRTDVRQVLDFIRFSGDRDALRKLLDTDPHFQALEEDALDVIVRYAGIGRLARRKKYYREDGKFDMCTALNEMIEDGRKEGLKLGREQGMKLGEERGLKLGEERGMKLGEERGLKLGEERGFANGQKSEQKRLAMRLMKNMNLTEQQAADILGISLNSIE